MLVSSLSSGVTSMRATSSDNDSRASEIFNRIIEIQVADTEEFEIRGELYIKLSGTSRILTYEVEPEVNLEIIKRNLELSRQIIDFVNRRILFSTTYPNRVPCFEGSYDELRSQMFNYVNGFEINVHKRTELALKYRMGNCGEMTICGLSYPGIGSVHVEAVSGDNHAFLVVGRDSTTTLENPSTWNPETVICDPWAKAYYPANRYQEFLMGYLGIYLSASACHYARVEHFDPQKHKIESYG